MTTKVRIDGPAILKARSDKKMSRQELCNTATLKGLSISRPSIERMEAAKGTDLFVLEKVKIVAEVLDINLGEIIQIERDSVDKIETSAVTTGRRLQEIFNQTEKLIIDVQAEPSESDLQSLIIKSLTDWDNEAKGYSETQGQIDQIKDAFEKKNVLDHLGSNNIFVYHGRTHQIGYFEIIGDWTEDDDGNPIEFVNQKVQFSSTSYESFESRPTSNGHDFYFDGVAAQVVDYIVLSSSEKAPTIFHQTNPLGFPQGTLDRCTNEFNKFETERKKFETKQQKEKL